MIEAMKKRRSVYVLGRKLHVPEKELIERIEEATRLTPDAFNSKSARVVIVLGEKQNQLWETIYDAFLGKVPREKIDMFKAAYGTVLFFYDCKVVEQLQASYPAYAPKFEGYSMQALGMLEYNVWTLLAEWDLGASLQHYNPVIDEAVHKLFELPENWILNAQMPFGSIEAAPGEKPGEDISERVFVLR